MQHFLRKSSKIHAVLIIVAYVVVGAAILATAPLVKALNTIGGTVTQIDANTFRVDNAANGFDCNYTWGVDGTVDLNDTTTGAQLASGQYGTCTYLGGNSFEISFSQWGTQPTNGQTIYLYYNQNAIVRSTYDFTYSSQPPAPAPSVTQLGTNTFRVDNVANDFDCNYTWGVDGTVDVNDATTGAQLASGQYGTCTYLGGNSFEINYSQWNTQPTSGQTIYLYYNQDNLRQITDTIAYNALSTITFNSAGDTYLRSGEPIRNQGAGIFMRLQANGNNRSMVRFDQSALESAIGNGTILSAKLRLTITDNGNNWGTTGRTVDLHRLLANWAEGNGTENDRGTGSGATWNCATDSNISNQNDDCSVATAWNMSNSSSWPFASAATATTTITNNQSGVVELDVTSDVQSFMSGSSQNYGWLLKKTNEGQTGKVNFGTKESSSSPQLVVTYQP